MESDKRPRWPYGFENDELDIIENLTMGLGRGCRCRQSNNNNSQNCNNNNGCNNGCNNNNSCNNSNKDCSNNDCGNESSNNSSCRVENCRMPSFDKNVAVAMVYSPDHEFECMYSPEDGLLAGTLFIALDKPFYGAKVNGGCRE